MNASYEYAVQPISPHGSEADRQVMMSPVLDAYPMTCWRPSDGSSDGSNKGAATGNR